MPASLATRPPVASPWDDRLWPFLSVRRSAAVRQLSGRTRRSAATVHTAVPDPNRTSAALQLYLGNAVLLTSRFCIQRMIAEAAGEVGLEMSTEITGVVAGTVDKRGFSTSHKLSPHQINA
jgi:hypothetical protein